MCIEHHKRENISKHISKLKSTFLAINPTFHEQGTDLAVEGVGTSFIIRTGTLENSLPEDHVLV